MRSLKIAGVAIAATIAVAALALMIGIPSDLLTSEIQARVEYETGYRLTVAGSTRIAIWPQLRVTLNEVTLEPPKDREISNRLNVGSVQADMTLESVWSGHPHITGLAIVRPVLVVPLLRERLASLIPSTRPAAPGRERDANPLAIDRITVTDGVIEFSNLRDRVEKRIEAINAETVIGNDRSIKITGGAYAGEHPLKFEIKATAPTPPLGRQNIPVELTVDASGLSQRPLSAKAEVRLNGMVVMINGLSGTLADSAFNGWASVDVASKPLLKLDLDFQRLDVAGPAATSGAQGLQPWSNATFDLAGLNYADAQIKVSAAELNVGEAHFAPVAIDAALDRGVLHAVFQNLGAYGGEASGELSLDASAGGPTYTLRSDLVGVRALPLLQSAAGFDGLDGKLRAKLALHSSGSSQRAILSNLGGTAFAVFQDGAIRGLNLARMIRSLTSGTLSGWQETRDETTDLSQLSASFRIEKGHATTGDLNLVGPLVKMTGVGTVDLGTQMLAFRVEPKLVLTTQGQGRASDPVGLGVPVVVDGSWAEPRIYPDVSGILDDPDAAYARLKELGNGLFGQGREGLPGLGRLGGDGSAGPLGGNLGETLGNLLHQGLVSDRGIPPPAASPPAPAPTDASPQAQQDSQPMNEVLRQLFNR